MELDIRSCVWYIVGMKFDFADESLRKLWMDPGYTDSRSPAVVKGFRKAIGLINAVPHEAALRQFRGLNFEELKGKRSHQHSVRLNDQFRLILELKGDGQDKVAWIVGIENHYR